VQHESPKNFQLHVFTPDDGHFEYYAVATNLPLALPCQRSTPSSAAEAQEKTIAELKGEFALDVVPTRRYGANRAWQQLSILAYNVAELSTRHHRHAPTPLSQAHLIVYAPGSATLSPPPPVDAKDLVALNQRIAVMESGSKLGGNQHQATAIIASRERPGSRLIAAYSARWCPMLPCPK
jgi:hypothetical protein